MLWREQGTAGGVKRDISSALTRGINAKRLCTRLKKKDGQMCELRYDKKFDPKTVSARARAPSSARVGGLQYITKKSRKSLALLEPHTAAAERLAAAVAKSQQRRQTRRVSIYVL